MLPQQLGDLRHGAGLLADGHVDADHILPLLVQDGVDGDSGLAGLAVADDQLTLAPADGEHGVDGQNARLHGGVHRLTVNNAGRRALDHAVFVHGDVSAAVDGRAQGVHHAANHAVGHADTGGLAGAVHRRALADLLHAAEQDTADTAGAQLLHHAPDAAFKQQDLTVGSALQALHIGDPVRHGQYAAHLAGAYLRHPALHRVPDQGDDGALTLQSGQPFLQLLQPALRRPVDDLAAQLNAESALCGAVLLPDQLDGLAVLFRQHILQLLFLRAVRRASAEQFRRQACISVHSVPPSRHSRRRHRPGPSGRPSASPWRPRQ